MSDLKTCPVPGCKTKHDRSLLMCKRHWFKVPKPLREEIWDSYKKDGVLSDRYLDARKAAIESLS